MSIVWLGLGSNIQDRDVHITQALNQLHTVLKEVKTSSVYESTAQDYLDQNDFLNMVLCGRTSLAPESFLEHIVEFEKDGGRKRHNVPPKGPRTIDIDILLWDDLLYSNTNIGSDGLFIPHPRMHKRLFVLKPLLDIDSSLKDPGDGISWSIKASQLSDQKVELYDHE